MDSSLNQLDDRAILILYIADELTPSDRTIVDDRLATEENFRAELESLRATHDSVMQSLTALDARQPVGGRIASAQREVLRQMQQWHVRRLSNSVDYSTKRARKQRNRIHWLLPVSGVAAALMGLMIWWSWTANPQLPQEDNMPVATNNDPNSLRVSLQLDSRDNSLAEVEQEMDALSDLRGLTR
jgi:anti-sigma factor RsiW